MGNNKKLTILLAFALLFGSMFSNFGAIKAFSSSNTDTKLKEYLIPIETSTTKDNVEDLQPLKEILQDKTIVGIGESTLGSKEFVNIKYRLVRFLVEEMGYRIFAIDAEFSDVKVVNDYIINGKGTIDDALWALRHFMWSTSKVDKDIFLIETHAYLASWTTIELKDMIEWMKEYNLKSKDKIKFYGIDMEIPEKSMDDLLEYLYKVDESVGEKYSQRLSDLVTIYEFNLKHPQPRALGLFSGMIEEISNEFTDNEKKYIEATSKIEYEIINQDINSILQWIDYRKTNLNHGAIEALNVRNYYMAENVKWILNFEKQFNNKIVVLSHNNYISKRVSAYKSMGENLSELYENEYYAIGLDFYEGRFRAYAVNLWGNPIANYLAKFNINSSPKDTLVYKLEKTDMPISYLDFKTASKDDDIYKLLSNKQSIHNIGLMYPGKHVPSRFIPEIFKQFSKEIPLEAYDGFVFVRNITETTGVYDLRDTKIEDGDKELVSYYLHIVFGQIYFLVVVILLIILIAIFIKRKIRNKKLGKGARYPNSSRWD